MNNTELDALCVNTLRFLSVDAIQKANSGHPGLPLGAAPLVYVLWSRFLKANPQDPEWFDRDRFVLSAGHGSALLYSLLHLFGYDLSLEELKQFRQWESRTPGHPERNLSLGVETTTGPLGQGFGNAVGMAIAEAHLAARFNRPGFEVIQHFTYCLASDGDLMEGVANEAASLAGHLKLGKLICLYDSNRITLAGSADLTFSEDVAGRFTAQGWTVLTVNDGNDREAIDLALRAAQTDRDHPSLIIVRTHIGYGSPHKQGTFEAHGSPLGEAEVKLTKDNLGWPVEPSFFVPIEVREHCRKFIARGDQAQKEWDAKRLDYQRNFPDLAEELRQTIRGELPKDWNSAVQPFPPNPKGMATRVASSKIMNALSPSLPQLFGGSADLNPSTLTTLKGRGDFQPPLHETEDTQGSSGGEWNYAGCNVHFGVREHAMGAILNGIACHGGLIPYGATFLIFSDYLRPAIRLSALMGLQTIWVFTHDSIALGEDGPTHQPVEQLAALRAIPNLRVIRPADANETAVAWQVAIESRDCPTALVLTRQNVPVLDRSQYAPADGLWRGAYILAEAKEGKPDVILIASGSEVQLIVAAQERLKDRGIKARLVSMPSWELFENQPPDYRQIVLPANVKARLAIEAGSPQGWSRYVGDQGDVIGVKGYGASSPGEVVLREYGFTTDLVVAKVLELVEKK